MNKPLTRDDKLELHALMRRAAERAERNQRPQSEIDYLRAAVACLDDELAMVR